LVMVCH